MPVTALSLNASLPDTGASRRVMRLAKLIAIRSEPVILIEAHAGMGKSRLLKSLHELWAAPIAVGDRPPVSSGGCLLWDLPPGSIAVRIPDLADGEQLVIARRPDTPVPGLDRLAAYGQVYRVPLDELLWTVEDFDPSIGPAEANELLAVSGGWPLLLTERGPRNIEPDALTGFIVEEILSALTAADLVRLALISGGRPIDGRGLPLVRVDENGQSRIAGSGLEAPVDAAIRLDIRRRIADVRLRTELADAGTDLGYAAELIIALQQAGEFEAAERMLEANHGWYFHYMHGATAFDAVMAGFTAESGEASDTLVLSRALQALKHGEVALARRLIADRFGADALDARKVLGDRRHYSAPFRGFRLVMLIYEDVQLTEEMLGFAFNILADLSLEQHLLRGSIYNSILEFYLRGRRFGEAGDVAERALLHYRAAGAGLLAFYISLHLAIMRLMAGDAAAAAEAAADAERDIGSLRFDSPHDTLLLKLLKGCIAYEDGSDEELIRFLNQDLDRFSHGEIWPTLIEFALQYGSQALSRRYSTIAARSFLDRWRVYQLQNRQFQLMIDSRDVIVMQNGNRWREAAERLSTLTTSVSRATASDPEALARLSNRDEVAIALCWLRHVVFESPTRPELAACLMAIHGNLAVTPRQRVCVEVWSAYVFKRQRDMTRARAQLQATFEGVARHGSIGPLSEETVFLSDLLANRRIADFLTTSTAARQVLRRLRDFGFGDGGPGTRGGLSRQEIRVLIMISEGASNKFVANRLQLSEATVKFHLGNVYRKLGCSRRREAIAAARALGLVG
jgi:DNA-binding CsgD family transcriptional regulator